MVRESTLQRPAQAHRGSGPWPVLILSVVFFFLLPLCSLSSPVISSVSFPLSVIHLPGSEKQDLLLLHSLASDDRSRREFWVRPLLHPGQLHPRWSKTFPGTDACGCSLPSAVEGTGVGASVGLTQLEQAIVTPAGPPLAGLPHYDGEHSAEVMSSLISFLSACSCTQDSGNKDAHVHQSLSS